MGRVARHCRIVTAALLLALAPGRSAAAQQADGVAGLLRDLETALRQASADALTPLLAPDFDRMELAAFTAGWAGARVTGAVIHERDRRPDPETGRLHLVLEVLLEIGQTARMLTLHAGVVEADRWRFVSIRSLASMEGLHRLELDTSRQFRAHNLTVTAEDFELVLSNGDVFVCTLASGLTVLVLVRNVQLTFHPEPET